jgi:hypothetical protein
MNYKVPIDPANDPVFHLCSPVTWPTVFLVPDTIEKKCLPCGQAVWYDPMCHVRNEIIICLPCFLEKMK